MSAVEVLMVMVEVSAVRTEAGSAKSIEEGSPPDGKSLRMVDMMMFTVLGVLMGLSLVSWARPGSGSAGAVEDHGLAGGKDCRRKFQEILHNGWRGVHKGRAEGCRGHSCLEFNKRNLRCAVTRFKATDVSVPSDLKKPKHLKLPT